MKKIALFLISLLIISIFCGCINLNDNDKPKIVDTDGDGYPDSEDDFPNDPAASIDSDGDGYPDSWNPGKSQEDSTSVPPLELDDLPNNPDDWKDSDGDKVGDKTDAFPDDPNEWSDLDKDGVGDNSDINPTVDLSISVSISKFKVTKKVDLLKWAQVYFDITIDGETKRIDNSGRFWRVWLNKEQNVDHEPFVYDIPDNTKEEFTSIEIVMYDHDILVKDDIIDINSKSGEKTLKLEFNNVENKISYEEKTTGSKGILWLDISSAENDDLPNTNTITRTYNWRYRKNWQSSIDIPEKTYNDYANSTVNRRPQSQTHKPYEAMARFVTSDEKVIRDLAIKLKILANGQRYNSIETINFILSFVQLNVNYCNDSDTKGENEYWRFPVETLVDEGGDCEDSAVLFAAIMDALGYDVALLYYTWEEGDELLGHLAVGIHLLGNHGHFEKDENGKKYFYCETASEVFIEMGERPAEIKVEAEAVIPI